MAKIKKRRLRWTASDSAQVVGYKLYWAAGGEKVSYQSPSEKLGNVTEIVLPDGVASFSPPSGPVEFGITAIDELGNESDLVTIAAPYQFNVPKAPEKVWIENADKSVASPLSQKPESASAYKPGESTEEPTGFTVPSAPSVSAVHGSLKAMDTQKTEATNNDSGAAAGSSQPGHPNISLAIRRSEDSV